ncbi:MAG: SGNH/GDSL hydrolase family protein [Bacteroidaceae bacterium]|nr:SGNH/GDSL hydrolase family protein [Bacteroidaceae bacterium]
MKEYVRLILILLIPLLLVSIYSISGHYIAFNGWKIGKVRIWEQMRDKLSQDKNALSSLQNSSPASENEPPALDSLVSLQDSISQQSVELDTCGKRILFFGDSMIEGLAMRFADYADENGHKLYSVCWYGSSTLGWASNLDTLQSFLNWSQADYVVVSLGGNELRVKDLEARSQNIRKIQDALKDRPTVWIAPPSWIKNPTITGVIRETVGEKRYFDSTRLKFNRGSDNMHPTFGSASRWMDSIAVWLSSPQTAHPIRMNPPQQKYPRKWHKKLLFPKQKP